MKRNLLCAALGLASLGVSAQELVGRVISSTPVVQQVAVPRQVCSQPIAVQQAQQTSGAGGLLGAIAGAALGSQVGGGSGRAAGMMIGAVGGALIGNSVEADGARPAYPVAQCTTENTFESRTVGYNVTYEVDGRQYTTQMANDPGPTVRLQMSPVGAQPAPAVTPQAVAPGGPVVVAPPRPAVVVHAPAPVVYSTYPPPMYAHPVYVQPAYGPYPVYRHHPPVQLHLGIGYSRGWRHHHHHH